MYHYHTFFAYPSFELKLFSSSNASFYFIYTQNAKNLNNMLRRAIIFMDVACIEIYIYTCMQQLY